MSGEIQKVLKDWQKEVIYYIERVHSVTGQVPSSDDIIKYLNTATTIQGINFEHIRLLMEDELFKKSMAVRGIPVDNRSSLSAKQMAAASLMLNLTDRRSDEKKLRDIGVTTEEFSTWMQNKEFTAYMRDRSEAMISNSVHEAHMGLMRGVKQGNTASIKLYYEMTGRYNSNDENQVNVRMLIARILETIQKHVRDPDILNRLAVEMSQLAIEAGTPLGNNQQVVQGESSRKELL